MAKFSLKRGLDIPILGSPEQKIYKAQEPKTIAIMGTDFNGLKPKMLISEGDKVNKGTPLFCHKDSPEIIFVSPCKGKVNSINRGERRTLLSVVITVESLDQVLINARQISHRFIVIESGIVEMDEDAIKTMLSQVSPFSQLVETDSNEKPTVLLEELSRLRASPVRRETATSGW